MKHSNIIWLLSFMLYVVSSCSQNELANPDNGHTGDISLRLSFAGASVARAASNSESGDDGLNENRIKTLDVFIYKVGDDNCAYYQHIVPSAELTGTGEYVANLSVFQEAFEFDAEYVTYVVANYTGVIPADGYTLSGLKDLSISGLNPDTQQDYFLMDGMAPSMVLNNRIIVNKEISASLKRAASKIRVKVICTNGYTLESGNGVNKKLMHYAASSRALESGNAFAPGLSDMPDFTASVVDVATHVAFVMYAYANDWNSDMNNETYILLDVPMSRGIIVYAHNYYRIPVNYRLPLDENDESMDAFYKLQRNYLYDISVTVDTVGSPDPETAVELTTQYKIMDWTTKDVLVSVEGINFLYVEDTRITMPNSTKYTTTFQSSTPVTIGNIKVNGKAPAANEVNIEWNKSAKAGNIVINSTLPNNFVAKTVTFSVTNESGLTQNVQVEQYPALYIGYDISLDAPDGSQGQNNKKMFIINSFVADFSSLPDPDEFDEDFGTGYTHFAPDPVLGASYTSYIRANAVLGYPRIDADGNTIDSEENNRRISPRFMLASQHGATASGNYVVAKDKCNTYVERDSTTGETYSDWRMPTLAEIYMIDILQNIRLSDVKKILEGGWYWSARQSGAVQFMDPRVGNIASSGALRASVRCVRDVKDK